MKVGDKIKIISLPEIDGEWNNYIQQKRVNETGNIHRIFKYGERNIVVKTGKYGHLTYLKPENIELI